MAFPWLAAAATGAGIIQSFMGRDEPEGLREQRQLLADATTYGRAAINPQSPHFRAVSTLYDAERKRNLVSAMNEMMKMQNRARARGVVGPLTNPERRDETIASFLSRGFLESGDRSRQMASQTLSGAAQGARATAAGYQGPVGTAANVEGANYIDRLAGIEAIPDFANLLGKAYNQSVSPSYTAPANMSQGLQLWGA